MLPDSLSADLRDHMYWWLEQGPRGNRRWVMDISWLNEVRQIEARGGSSWWAFCPPPPIGGTEIILGIPVAIREHDDRPGWLWRVPHLEEVAP